MSDGNSFHNSAPTTMNDRLPTVLRRMNGVVRRLVEAMETINHGRRRSKPVSAGHISNASEIGRVITWCTAVERAVSQDGDFETDSLRYCIIQIMTVITG